MDCDLSKRYLAMSHPENLKPITKPSLKFQIWILILNTLTSSDQLQILVNFIPDNTYESVFDSNLTRNFGCRCSYAFISLMDSDMEPRLNQLDKITSNTPNNFQ